MKKKLQTTLLALVACLFGITPLMAQGPDAFGYTWKSSTEVGGPTLNWIDITTVGTEVDGLADDNAVGPIPMGMTFHYYWSDYNKIKIGSNGWLSFDNVPNIASCFPDIPTADTKNNLICPMMADLNFDNGSAGKVYTYHDQTPGDEKFIISYINVTFWVSQAMPAFGSNTFQVIFAKADSSITFQYQTMDADFTYTGCTGAAKVGSGIENLTGNIGLQVTAGTVPASNHAVKFYYPQTITLSIVDAAPASNNNEANEGIFLFPGTTASFSSVVTNSGNTAITSAIDVATLIESFPDADNVYSDDQTVPSLAVGASQTVNFADATIDWTPGVYAMSTFTDYGGDVNPTNDFLISEVGVLDTTGGVMKFGYVTGTTAAASIQWTGGGDGSGGGGIKVESPVYPVVLAGAEAGIAGGSVDGFTFKIFDDDGPNGGPGTLLGSYSVAGDQYVAGNWNQFLFDDPVTITSGAFYLGWFMDGQTVALLVEQEGPISNRTYEILSNAWAKYRVEGDAMLRAISEVPTIDSEAKDVVQDENLQVFPNPSNGVFNIDNSEGTLQFENIRLLNNQGSVVFEEKTALAAGQQKPIKVDLPAGMYYLNLKTEDGKTVVRKLAVE